MFRINFIMDVKEAFIPPLHFFSSIYFWILKTNLSKIFLPRFIFALNMNTFSSAGLGSYSKTNSWDWIHFEFNQGLCETKTW